MFSLLLAEQAVEKTVELPMISDIIELIAMYDGYMEL